MSPTHHSVHALADQLVVEYAGAIPPGQVLALVYRTAHQLSHLPGVGPDWRTGTCERLVREALTERLGTRDRTAGAA